MKERAKMTPDEVKCGFSPHFEGMPGVIKKPKKFKTLVSSSENFKTVWQG